MSDEKWEAVKAEFAAHNDQNFLEDVGRYPESKRDEVEYCWWLYDRHLRPAGQTISRGRTRLPR